MTDGKTIDELLVEWDGSWLECLKLQIYDIQHHRQLHDEFMELAVVRTIRIQTSSATPSTGCTSSRR